jgi:hypothetical protein
MEPRHLSEHIIADGLIDQSKQKNPNCPRSGRVTAYSEVSCTEWSVTNSGKSARDYGSTCSFATIPNASSNLGWRRLYLNCSQ